MIKNLSLLFLTLLVISCTRDKKTNSVRFVGEIVNPTSDHVILFKGKQKIDSVQLDDNNRFSFSLDSIQNGLYHFNHTPEFQYVYLENGDSVVVRLNTMSFDESLIFSGNNEEINNFLLGLFLANEEEEKAFNREYYALSPTDFLEQLNKLRSAKISDLDAIMAETKVSDNAYEMAMASIDYTYNGYKETYPFKNKRITKAISLPELPNDFYAYRKQIDYNNNALIYLRPYYDFMKVHLSNLSYVECTTDCDSSVKGASKKLHYNKHKLHLIDSLVKDKELRDNLFRNVAIEYLLKKQDVAEHYDTFIKEFKSVSKNNIHIEEIDNLHLGIMNLQPNKVLPNVELISFSEKPISLPEIAKEKNVIFYFWSSTSKKQYENTFKRVAELSKNKPDYQLIGVNIKTPTKRWKEIVISHQLDTLSHFHAHNFKRLTETLVLYPMNKAIIIENGLIKDGFSNLYDN